MPKPPRKTKPAPTPAPTQEARETADAEKDLPSYSMTELAAQLKAPPAALMATLRSLQSADELVSLGNRVASERVLSDGARILSAAFHYRVKGSPEVQAVLDSVGLTATLVSAALVFVIELQQLKQRHDQQAQKSTADRSQVRERAVADWDAAMAARDDGIGIVEHIARADKALSAKLEALRGPADTAAQLAQQLIALVELAEAALGRKDEKVQALVELRGLTAAAPQRWRSLQSALLASDEALRTLAPSEKVSQSALDLLDGQCLIALRDVLRALDRASLRTPLVRRVTLYTLRSFLRGRAAGAGAEPTPAGAEPAPAAA